MGKKSKGPSSAGAYVTLHPEVALSRADRLVADVKALQAQLQRRPKDRGLQALLKATERRLNWYESRIPGRRPKAPRLSDIALGRVAP